MTKSIEQIALEAGITPEQLNQCLAKIGEGLEPVGCVNKADWDWHKEHTPETSIGVWQTADYKKKLTLPQSIPMFLYTTPHEAIIAAEQRIAEACSVMVESKFDFVGNELLVAEAIRSGEWRKYAFIGAYGLSLVSEACRQDEQVFPVCRKPEIK